MIFVSNTILSGVLLPAITFLGNNTTGSATFTSSAPGLLVLFVDYTGAATTVNGVAPTRIAGGATTTPQMYQVGVGVGSLTVSGPPSSAWLITNLISTSPIATANVAWGNASTPSTTQSITTSSQGVCIVGNRPSGTTTSSISGLTSADAAASTYYVGHVIPTGSSQTFTITCAAGPTGGSVFMGASWR